MKIVFCGDIHAEFHAIEQLIDLTAADIIIQAGDFGIWPDCYHRVKVDRNVPVYFCRGNHENHDLLDTFPIGEICNLKTSERINNPILSEKRKISNYNIRKLMRTKFPHAHNIYLCNTGSILTLNNKNILFLGGADSIDRNSRTIGKSWWPQEIFSLEDFDLVSERIKDKHIDIVVSHTAPKFIVEQLSFIEKLNDPTTKALELIFDMIKPELWIFGHFHKYIEIQIQQCKFIGLDTYPPGLYTNLFYSYTI